MRDTIACLSIRQPWASLCAWGIKPIENREWYCALRGPLVIHAGKTWKDDEQAAYDELMQIAIDIGDVRRQEILSMSRSLLGGFVGVAKMTACITVREWHNDGGKQYDGRYEWFTGPFGFSFAASWAFPQLVPYKGMRGIFRVPVRDVPYLMEWDSSLP
jgi:hypothetical protein